MLLWLHAIRSVTKNLRRFFRGLGNIFKVNTKDNMIKVNKNTRKRYEICSHVVVDFEYSSHLFSRVSIADFEQMLVRLKLWFFP